MQKSENQQHPLYPETRTVPVCPECEAEDTMYEVRGRFFCTKCTKRAEENLVRNIDFEIKEAKYKGSVYAANYKLRDYWYD